MSSNGVDTGKKYFKTISFTIVIRLLKIRWSITFILFSYTPFRCDSENCRALLARYDAPPAHDAANEESSSLQVRH